MDPASSYNISSVSVLAPRPQLGAINISGRGVWSAGRGGHGGKKMNVQDERNRHHQDCDSTQHATRGSDTEVAEERYARHPSITGADSRQETYRWRLGGKLRQLSTGKSRFLREWRRHGVGSSLTNNYDSG